jgi:hypothetical protein
MDKKYIARNVGMKAETVEKLEVLQKQMATELGFKPSLQEVVLRLIALYERTNPAPLEGA